MALKLFACLVLLSATSVLAQEAPKSIALTNKSEVPPREISESLQKECPNVTITNDIAKSDYTLEALQHKGGGSLLGKVFDLTLFGLDGKLVRATSSTNLGTAVKDVCHAIKTAIIVEVVDTQNLTESEDVRGSGGVVPALTGRRTHTDISTMNVVANGEHATLDCYERRTGCTTVGPGKYYGELDGESIWVDYEMPLTHKRVRNHYKIAGSW